MLTILTNPNPLLRRVSIPVIPEDLASKETQAYIDELEVAMVEHDGVGLASPQVGIAKRIISTNVHGKTEAFINPEIIEKSFRTALSEEGCLSVPGIYGLVKRHKNITVKALNRAGKEVVLKLTDLSAFVFQHEIDHLDGILFIDKVEKYTHV